MQKKVTLTIVAIARCTITPDDGESVDDVKNRGVDIYLHGAGVNGYANKADLGAYKSCITVNEEYPSLIVPRGLLLALVDTVKNNTDLQNIYDDTNGTSYSWEKVNRVLGYT